MTTNARQTDPPQSRSTAELLKDLSDQISHLVRKEIQLATAEMQTKGRRFGFGADLLGLAGVFAFYAGTALVAAAVLLALVLPAWAAALIVAAVLAIVAAVVAVVAREQVRRAAPPTPQQAVSSIRQDIEAVREGTRR